MTNEQSGGSAATRDAGGFRSSLTWVKMLAIAVLGAVLYLSFSGVGGSSRPGTGLPPFELELLSGGTLKSDALQGKVTVLNFFATWCAPCLAELPDLNAFAKAQDPSKVVLYGVAAGFEHRLDVRAFVEKHKMAFPVALDGEPLLSAVQSQALPTTVVIDAEGRVDTVVRGMVNGTQLEEMVARAAAPHTH